MFRDLSVNVVGGLITAVLLFAIGRFLSRPPGPPESRLARLGDRLFDGLGNVSAAVPPGPLVRPPRLRTVASVVVTAAVLLVVHMFHPLVGPLPTTQMGARSDESGIADSRARMALQEAQQGSDLILSEARSQAAQVVQQAVSRESALTRSGVAATLPLVDLARVDAARIVEEAHNETRARREDARERANRLFARADSLLLRAQPAAAQATILGFIGWPMRLAAQIALASLLFRGWGVPGPSGTLVAAGLGLAVLFAALSAAVAPQPNPVAYLLPSWVAAAAIAARAPGHSAARLALSAVALLQQRWGYVLGVLLLQWLLIDGLAIVGSYAGLGVAAYYRGVLEGANTTWVGLEEYYSFIGRWFGAAFGFELGAACAVAVLSSVLLGRSEGTSQLASRIAPPSKPTNPGMEQPAAPPPQLIS